MAQVQQGKASSANAATGGEWIPVNWEIVNFDEKLLAGDVMFSKIYHHDSLQNSSRLVVCLIASFSPKKSAATFASAGLSIGVTSSDGNGTSMQHRLPTRVFRPRQTFHECNASAREDAQLLHSRSVVVCGKITIDVPASCNFILRRMYQHGMFSDLLIEGESQTFSVHKNVLYEACPAILDLLTVGEEKLCIPAMAEAVKAMLQYVYGDPLSFAQLQNLSCEVLELAEKFSLAPLKRMCESALVDTINRASVVDLARLASRTNADDLKTRVFEFAAKNFDDLVLQRDALKSDDPPFAMSFYEGIIEALTGGGVAQAISSDGTTLKSKAAAPFEVPVRWEIADFKNLMENSDCGASITCKETFSHESMPGIAWELILYPNGKEDCSHHVALFMRPVLTSNKKSQATAPSGGYALRLELMNNTNVNNSNVATTTNTTTTTAAIISAPPPPEQTLPVRQFNLTSELGIAKFAPQSLIDARCLVKDKSVVLTGKILVEPPPCDQVLFSRKLFESSKHADFTVKVGEESFAGHKSTLSEASPTMGAMLDMQCKESENNAMEIKESNVEAVRALLQFWYGDPLCFDGLEELSMDVYQLANRYQDNKLRQICVDALSRMASRENVVHLAAFAVDQCCEPLEKLMARLIVQNADILKKEAWAQFKQENFKLALAVAERIISLHRKQ